MTDQVPDRSAMLEALALLGTPPEALAAFPSHPEDLAHSFADAFVDAPAAIYTDWRFHPAEALNDVWQRLYPHGVKGMIDEEDDESGFPKKILLQHAGSGTRYRIRIKDEEPNLHYILFALDKVLPADLRIMSLRPYEVTDSYLHIVQPTPVFAKVRELLGEWFGQVFATHETPLAFIKTGGNLKPKRKLAKKWIKDSKEWLMRLEPEHHKARSWMEMILQSQDIADYAIITAVTEEKRKREMERFSAKFPLPRRFHFMCNEMHTFALRMMIEGAIDVLEEQPSGWNRIHLAMQYEVLRLRISQEMGHDRIIDQIVDESGRLLALAWALGDMKVVNWISEELIRFPSNFTGWQFTPLEPMLLQLYALWKNIEINWQNYPKAKLGVYRSLFDTWNDPAKLLLALEMCCDYHGLRTGESGFQEFSWTPFDIFPAEILAAFRLREMQGLSTPTIEHELLQTPLGKLPMPIKGPTDELLQKIIDTISREHPNFPW